MCGIVGYWGGWNRDLIERMSARMAHRGPDDSGIWRDERRELSLGHRRLSILDLSPAGHQPFTIEHDDYVLAYNGEIYNFPELRRTLEGRGIVFRSHTDTEVILRLYQIYGTKCFAKLNGIFSLALWDRRNQELLLARDGLGVKPLYYAADSRGVIFGSEIKSLLCDPQLDRSLDPQAVRHHVIYHWCPGPRTALRAVKKVRPGTFLRLKNQRIVDEKVFYELPMGQEPELSVRPAQAVEELRAYLERAVKRQLLADVPVGAFLSGGLDSSSLVACARKQVGGDFRCFTIDSTSVTASSDGFADDLPYARKVAEHLGVSLDVVKVGPRDLGSPEALEKMLYFLDEPQADPAPLNVLYISELARQQGIKVLLSGAGGDDLFSGYRRHVALRFDRWSRLLPKELRKSWAPALRGMFDSSSMWGRRFHKILEGWELEGDERLARYYEWTPSQLAEGLFSKNFSLDRDLENPFLETLQSLPPGREPLERMLHLDLKYFLTDHNLNYTDKMSMAAGVEVRVPYLDLELVSWAARLPTSLKMKGYEPKWILKKAMKGILPREVIYRPKSGFGAPLRSWLKGDLKEMVSEVLSPRSLKERGIFDPAAVHAFLRADAEGRRDSSYSIFSLVCIELWCRLFLKEDFYGKDSSSYCARETAPVL